MNAPDDKLDRTLRWNLQALAQDAPPYDPEHRRSNGGGWKLPAAAVAGAALGVVAWGAVLLTDSAHEPPGEAVCPNRLIVAGTEYIPAGDLQRMPVSAGLISSGSLPGGCDDGGGANARHTIDVHSIPGVPPHEAVLAGDKVWVNGTLSKLPSTVQHLREPITCRLNSILTVRGDILSADSATAPKFDGDLTAPYTLELRTSDPRLTQGDEWRWVIVRMRGLDEAAVPSRDAFREMLYAGKPAEVALRCEGPRFVAQKVGLASA